MAPVISKTKRRACIAIVISQCVELKEKRKHRFWERQWLTQKRKFSHINLLQELQLSDCENFRNYLRMSEESYNELLCMVTPFLRKQDTQFRKAITVNEKLSATLRFLATGRSFEDLKFSCCISAQALGRFIPETCRAIYAVLRKQYMKFPNTQAEWEAMAGDFGNHWNFFNCVGAVDGKHIEIVKPPGSGSYYYNYKNFFSVVLLAVVNSQYEFIMVDIGKNGRISDGGVIRNTKFYERMMSGTLNLPPDAAPPGSRIPLPYVFVGDEAFAAHVNFLRPYPQREITDEKRIFNYRLSRARRVVENAFGILSSRFQIFQKPINLSPEKVEDITLACCVLHNFLRRKFRKQYTPQQALDFEDTDLGIVAGGEWRNSRQLCELQRSHSRKISQSAAATRDSFCWYFNNEGKVPWQNHVLQA